MQTIFLRFSLPWLCVSAARFGTPVGNVSPAEDDDEAASRALEAAIMGLPETIVSNATQERQLVAAEDAILANPPKLRKAKAQGQPQRASQKEASVAKKKQSRSQGSQYPPSGAVAPATPGAPVAPVAPAAPPPQWNSYPAAPVAPVAAPVVPAAPVATSAPSVVVPVTTVAPDVSAAPEVLAPTGPTAAPLAVADLDTWKMQMESKLHRGLSSEIKILNTLMTHQTQTHKQLIRFKQVLTVLGGKYKSQEQLAMQQAAKITNLEQQLAGLTHQVNTLNAKFDAYKKQYETKWQGSQTAIDHLYKKTADALGAMSAVHDDVQKELNVMGQPATVAPTTAPPAAAAPIAPVGPTQPAPPSSTIAPSPSPSPAVSVTPPPPPYTL